MQQLTEYELVPESWGGETIMVELSALQNLGIDDLLEQLVLVAEVEDLRAVPTGKARGTVLERFTTTRTARRLLEIHARWEMKHAQQSRVEPAVVAEAVS